MCPEHCDNISDEEYSLFLSSTSEETDEAASEIVKLIMEIIDSTPKKFSDVKLHKSSC